MEMTFVAPDIECGGCAASITKTLERSSGVQSVVVDVPSRSVAVTFDAMQSSREILTQALTEIGFPPETSSQEALV